MNDEIKEILDNVRKCCDIMQDENFVVYQKQDIINLLDYITNLQQELEEYKDTETYSKRFLYKANKDRLNANLDLVKENEKLNKENEKWWAIIKDNEQEIKNLCLENSKLEQENERLREELNGKQLREIHKINNYNYFKEMTNNWNREDFSKRCYDLCNEKVDLQQRIEKAVEYLKNNCYIGKCINTYEAIDITNVMDILNGRSDE